MASIRPNKARKRKRRRGRKARRNIVPAVTINRGHGMKRRKRSGRRRGFRRNPGGLGGLFKGGGLMKTVQRGVMDALYVTGGKVVARTIPTVLNLPRTGVLGIGIQAAIAAFAVPLLAGRFLGSDGTRFAVAGAMMGALESAAVAFNVPLLRGALSSYPDEALGALPPERESTLLPLMAGEDDYGDEGVIG